MRRLVSVKFFLFNELAKVNLLAADSELVFDVQAIARSRSPSVIPQY